jgi:transmembrane sensor
MTMNNMDELLAKYMLGEATASEVQAVDNWMKDDEKNRRYFADFKLIWESSKKLKIESKLDTDESWAEFKQMTAGQKPSSGAIKPLTARRKWMKIAAVWALFGMAGLLYFFLKPEGKATMISLQANNEVKTETLPDGSVITLNRYSLLTYPEKFSGDTREVKLSRGEAFFDIAHDKNKPFLIRVNDIMVRVVGTSFNIRNTKSETEVIVETGIVQVTRQKEVIRLKPSEMVVIRHDKGKMVKSGRVDELYNYYRTKRLTLDNTPLSRAVEMLNEAYHVNIIIDNKNMAEKTLTTVLQTDSLDNALKVISETLNARIIKKDGMIIIR